MPTRVALSSLCTWIVGWETFSSTHDEWSGNARPVPLSKATLKSSDLHEPTRRGGGGGGGPPATGSLDVRNLASSRQTRDTQGPYNSAPVFGSVWKAERAGKIKLFQKPGAFPSPRRIADRFSCVPLRSDTLSLTRRLPLSPLALTLSLSQFPSPARPSTYSLSLPPTFAPLTPSLSNRARSVVYPHHRRTHGPPPPLLLTPLVRLSPSRSPHPKPSFSGYPPPSDISRGSVVFLVPRATYVLSSLSYTLLFLYTRREWGEVSCSSNIPSTIHNRSMLARGDRGPKVDVHVRGFF